MTTGTRTQQSGDKDRPYWVYVWQGDISGGGTFGAGAGFTRYDQGFKGRVEGYDRTGPSRLTCVANCIPPIGTGAPPPPPQWRLDSERVNDPIPSTGDGKEPSVTAFTPAGLPGENGAIVSFFPPIEVDIDCQQSPLRIEGGQIPTIYNLTISARGYIRDFDSDEILIPFNVTNTTSGPGPIVGYTVTQYTLSDGARDLRTNVYYEENGVLGDFSKNFRLSLSSLLGGTNNLTLEGNNYYFDVQEVTLDNLVRADGLNDQCGNSECTVTWEVNYYLMGDPNTILTATPPPQNVPFTVARIGITGTPGTGSRQVFAYSEGDAQSIPIYGATASEVIISAPLLNIECSYDVNGQLPGCFIETPETCNVTIRDQAGILLDQTYFGRPEVTLSSEYPSGVLPG